MLYHAIYFFSLYIIIHIFSIPFFPAHRCIRFYSFLLLLLLSYIDITIIFLSSFSLLNTRAHTFEVPFRKSCDIELANYGLPLCGAIAFTRPDCHVLLRPPLYPLLAFAACARHIQVEKLPRVSVETYLPL